MKTTDKGCDDLGFEEVIEILKNGQRHNPGGHKEDSPEGVIRIWLSDTLAKKMAEALEMYESGLYY